MFKFFEYFFRTPELKTSFNKEKTVSELATRLAQNRSKVNKGYGKKYWKSQAQVCLDYFTEIDIIKK